MDLLEKLAQLEKDADDFGLQWETSTQILDQIKSECLEVEEHLVSTTRQNCEELQEELGDLLHAVFSLCVFCNLNPRQTLEKTLAKFERRLEAVKEISTEQGLKHLHGHAFKELMAIWQQAKLRVG